MKIFVNLVQNDLNGAEDLQRAKRRTNLTNGVQEALKIFQERKYNSRKH